MTWLELYNFLHERANKISKLGTVKWDDEILIHNAATGEEEVVDIWELSVAAPSDRNTRLTLVYNQLEYEKQQEGDSE